MRRRWYPLVEAGDDFLKDAPFLYVNSLELTSAPERTWAALTTNDTLVTWSRLVTGLRWTSPRPFMVGTTREVTILGVLTARERYHRWDEGRRKTFSAVQVSVPGLRRLAEDYIVERTPNGSRLTWTLAIGPAPALSAVLRVCGPLTARLVRHVLRGLPRRLAQRDPGIP